MKKKRYRAEQIVQILRDAERGSESIGEVSCLCVARRQGRRCEVSEATFYRWRRIYGGMQAPEVKRLRELEQENARLKKLVAERDLELDAMKDVLAKNG